MFKKYRIKRIRRKIVGVEESLAVTVEMQSHCNTSIYCDDIIGFHKKLSLLKFDLNELQDHDLTGCDINGSKVID